MSVITQNVKILTADERLSHGQVSVAEKSVKERVQASVKYLGLCWLLAGISIFIPILHFFLVPALLMAGPIVFLVLYQKKYKIVGGQGECPLCDCLFEIKPQASYLPLVIVCPGCQSPLDVKG